METELDAAIETATEAVLNRPVEKGFHKEKAAIESVIFLAWHEAYHLGAIGGIRKTLGYPGPAEIVRAKSASGD
jgi:hypothetical protein